MIGVSLPVVGIVAGTIIVAIGVGYGLDWVDKEIGATDHVIGSFRAVGEKLKASAEYLEKSMPKDYEAYPLMYTP